MNEYYYTGLPLEVKIGETMNYLTRPLDLASQLMNFGNRRNIEANSKVSPVRVPFVNGESRLKKI